MKGMAEDIYIAQYSESEFAFAYMLNEEDN